jgi:hypothetical protein
MYKLVNILKGLIIESKKYEMDPETYTNLAMIADNLYNKKRQKWVKQTFFDSIMFKTADGTKGMVKIYISPRLPDIAEISTKPYDSRDPMDFVMKLNPKKFGSKRGLFLTMYHEMMHAIDPSQSTIVKAKNDITYDPEKDESYWGHPIEFFAISNEFLEAFQLEIESRFKIIKREESKKLIIKSLDNILNYFSKGEKLSELSLDILDKMGEEGGDTKLSGILKQILYDYPGVSEFLPKKDEPYFLHYVELIKNHNRDIWNKFLIMLFKLVQEIKENYIHT